MSDAAQFIEFVHELSRRTLVIVDEGYLEFTPVSRSEPWPALSAAVTGCRLQDVRKNLRARQPCHRLHAGARRTGQVREAARHRRLFGLNRLSLVAADASLKDTDYIPFVRAKVAAERDAWHQLFRKRKVRFGVTAALFSSPADHSKRLRPALAAQGIDIGRGLPAARHMGTNFDRPARGKCGCPAGRRGVAAGDVTIIAGEPAFGLSVRDQQWNGRVPQQGSRSHRRRSLLARSGVAVGADHDQVTAVTPGKASRMASATGAPLDWIRSTATFTPWRGKYGPINQALCRSGGHSCERPPGGRLRTARLQAAEERR